MRQVAKVLAYITREINERTELLVFKHRDFPSAGIQVPAGTVEANEEPSMAVIREVWEEAGLHLKPGTFIGTYEHLRTDRHELHLRNVFHFKTTDMPNRWDHQVSGHGEDTKMVFNYYWITIEEAKSVLEVDQGKYLEFI